MPRRAETILTDTAIRTLATYSRAFGLAQARAAGDHAAGRDPIGAKQERRQVERQEREARSAARQGRPSGPR